MSNTERRSTSTPRGEVPERESGRAGEPFRIVFVCTGNTCRSPIAEAIARGEAERLGWKGLEIHSAGVAAAMDEPASLGAIRSAGRHGIDLSGHRSRLLDQASVDSADLLLAMSPSHLLALQKLGAGEKSVLLADFAAGEENRSGAGGRGVADPFGGGDREYEATFRELDDLVPRILQRLAPLMVP